MPSNYSASAQQLKQNETDIAVLQVQYNNIDEKIDEIKVDLKDLRNLIDDQMKDTRELVEGFQKDNIKAQTEITTKISGLEKWKWIIMGAAIFIGIGTGTGAPVIAKLLSFHW